MMKSGLLKLSLVVAMAILFSGCALNYRLNQPIPSDIRYDSGAEPPVVLKIVDQREDISFFKGIGGLAKFNIRLENVSDPIDWLARALQEEFAARGAAVKMVPGDYSEKTDLVLTVDKYQIANYRASGFTPWVAYHSFRGELKAADQRVFPIHAYFLYGKTPVWSMAEIHDPCLNMPMTIVVKEIVSKINGRALEYRLNAASLEEIHRRMTEELKTAAPDAYHRVLDLGGANNPDAMGMLVEASAADDTLARACALSAMGMLGAQDQFDYLKQKFEALADIDRFMALKSIGDIGTPEALDYLKAAKNDPQHEYEYGIQFCADLYLE